MCSADQLKSLIKSHIDGDDSHFHTVALQIAAHKAALGQKKLADQLHAIMGSGRSKSTQKPIKKAPIETNALLDASRPNARLSEMVLNKSVEDCLNRIIQEQRNCAKIQAHGLSPRRKIMLIGPPGTGKTLTASALASELDIPLFLVPLDSLITKFMGETASKLRQVFDAIGSVRGVYFFDEFDAIGSERSFGNDTGEIRRVLNSFLQMLERDESNSIVIVATNHARALDYALFRRFDEVIEYALPSREQIIDILKFKIANFKIDHTVNWDDLAEITEGLSYAEITLAIQNAIKNIVIHDIKLLSTNDLKNAILERKIILKIKKN